MHDLKPLSVQLKSLNTTYLFQMITPVRLKEIPIKFVLTMGVQYNSIIMNIFILYKR